MPSAAMPALPPGFRFHPTDEELIVHYLTRQAASMACPVPIIAEVNIYKCNPWELPGQALFGENEWFFFSPRDRKYPNGARPNRAAGLGYWKATGTDKVILSTPTSENIGVKKALVFYRGKPPKGVKTDWIMHEYRLTGGNRTAKRRGSSSMRLDDWVLCRIHKKSNALQQFSSDHEQEEASSTVEDSLTTNTNNSPKSEAFTGDVADEQFQFRPLSITKSCSLTDLLNTVDYAALSQMLLDGSSDLPPPPSDQPPECPLIYAPHQTQTLNYGNNYLLDMPQAMNEHEYANNYNSGSVKRKRSFQDGSGELGRKLPQLMPCDSSRTSSYCNQLQVADQTSTSYQYNSMAIHPFLNQQLLLNDHLQM